MNTNKIFIIGTVVLAVLAFAGMALYKRSAPSQPAGQAFNFDPSLLIRDHSPTKGPADAPVTVVEFLDPQCEACAAMHPIVKTLMREYEGRVRLVIRYIPFHNESLYAAALLEEARESGKFDQALDIFSERLDDWGGHHESHPERLAEYMQEIGIDKMRTERAYVMKKHEAKLRIDESDGQKLGVQRTPTFFVNGVVQAQIGYEPLKRAIEAALR